MKKYLSYLSVLLLAFALVVIPNYVGDYNDQTVEKIYDKNGYYTSANDVATYIDQYKTLPKNFLTKKQAMDLGWLASENNLWSVSDKKSIGGDKFFNREKLLPQKAGRFYYEADIDYAGGKRSAKRIVYSNDGLIFYTKDHYDSFIQLYGEK